MGLVPCDFKDKYAVKKHKRKGCPFRKEKSSTSAKKKKKKEKKKEKERKVVNSYLPS